MKYIINSFNKGNLKRIFIFGFSVIAIFIFYFFSFNLVNSGSEHNMSEFAWGAENGGGMGWLSFNSTDGGGSVNYGVNIDASNNLVGEAWSSNYRWLKFGGLSDFPPGGSDKVNARFAGNSKNLIGWARFCSAAKNPATCQGTESNSSNGGWDGWVSLSGESPDYVIKLLDNNTFSGYAWGGDVVGWIDFSKVKYNAPVVLNPTVTITANNFPNSIFLPVGNPVTIRWSGSNLIDNSTGCRASGSSWSGQKPSPSGSFGPLSLAIGNYEYKIECLDLGGTIWSPVSTVTVTIFPNDESVTLTNTAVKNNLTTLTWQTKRIISNSCIASASLPTGYTLPIPTPSAWTAWVTPPPNHKKSDNNSAGLSVYVPNTSPKKTTYILTCDRLYPDSQVLCGNDNTKICDSVELNEKSGLPKRKYKEN